MILQYGNVAGWPYFYALALRQSGIDSYSAKPTHEETPGNLDVEVSNRQLPTDGIIYTKADGRLRALAKRVAFTARCLRTCRLVHFHGTTILPRHWDTYLFRKAGIPMVISWAGSDARIIRQARSRNPYFFREEDDAWDATIVDRLQRIAQNVRFVATDPEMAAYSEPYFERVFTLAQPIDLSQCPLRIPAPDKTPLILHIPTRKAVKGTPFIEAAVDRLRSEGLGFEFRLIPPVLTQQQTREQIGEADIYVDELRCGSYGMTAVEAMACGKPTISYIRDDLWTKYPPGLPIVSANPDTICDQLRELIVDGSRRKAIGIASRQYVEKYHSLAVISPALTQIYRAVGLDIP